MSLAEHNGNQTHAATSLGMSRATFKARILSAKARGIEPSNSQMATLHGNNPKFDLVHPVPAPYILAGASTYYNKDGQKAGQWIKTKLDHRKTEELIKATVQALGKSIEATAPILPPPSYTTDKLLVTYPIGDPHFGMYAWAAESGEDFDLAIAKRLTLSAVDRLVDSVPNADVGIVLPLGDVFHADDQSNMTPGHGNPLDVDSRFVKVLGVGIEAFRHAILRALQKHNKVIVRFIRGNHDPNAVWALAFTIHAYFSNEPRVTVDLSPSRFWYYRFGKVLIGSTHGDSTKTEQLPGIMAADKPEDWGETKHRYWYTGHIHHKMVKEYPGVVCESFRTLAARDAWHAGSGYRAGRDMQAIVLHFDHGEVERHRCDIGMLS